MSLVLANTPVCVLAQNSDVETPGRSVAAVVPSPITVSPAKSTNHKSTTNRAAYSKTALQEKARKSYPSSHLEKGLYLKEKNDPNGALLEFLKATQQNPRLVKGFYEQALIFRSRGYRKLAESALEQALATKSDYTEARMLLATVRIEQGNLGGAVQELSRSLGLDSATNSQLQATHEDAGGFIGEVETMKSTPAAPAAKPAPSNSGLLSMDIPAILQSIHGALKAPFVSEHGAAESTSGGIDIRKLVGLDKLAGSGKESAERVLLPGETASGEKNSVTLAIINGGPASGIGTGPSSPETGTAEDSKTPIELDKKKKPKKEKHKKEKKEKKEKKSKTLLSRIKDGVQNLQASAEMLHNDHMPEVPQTRSVESQNGSLAKNQIEASMARASDAIPESLSKIVGGVDQSSTTHETVPSAPAPSYVTSGSTGSMFSKPNTFTAPHRAVPASGIIGGILASTPPLSSSVSSSKTLSPPKIKLDNDEWAQKLKSYVDHGANSLKTGEAFMFAEDTGEASLFLADGTTIRRIVAQPQDSQEVIKERRPDITASNDSLFGLALLGKLIPKMDDRQIMTTAQPPQQPLGSFRGDNLMSGTTSFFGWLKSVWKF